MKLFRNKIPGALVVLFLVSILIFSFTAPKRHYLLVGYSGSNSGGHFNGSATLWYDGDFPSKVFLEKTFRDYNKSQDLVIMSFYEFSSKTTFDLFSKK